MSFYKMPCALVFMLFGLTACLEDTKPADRAIKPDSARSLYELPQAQAVIENIGQNVINASYHDLDIKVQALYRASQKLSQERTSASVTAAQEAWKAARVPWESTESFAIGPLNSLGIDDKMDKWPLAVRDLQNVLNSGLVINADLVRSLDVYLQGFHAAEFLLFGDGVTTNTKDIAAFTNAEYSYLVAVTQIMAENTGAVVKAWAEHADPSDRSSPPFLDVFSLKTHAQIGGFTNRAQVLQTLVIDGMAKISDEVGSSKLATPFGANIALADPSRVESQFSWNSLTDFQNNVESMIHIYTGDYGSSQGLGLDELVRQVDPQLDRDLSSELQKAKTAIADIAGPEGLPFTRAIKDPQARIRIQVAIDEMKTLHSMIMDRLSGLVK